MHTNFPEYRVGYSVCFLFNYIFIKYVFICEKILCLLKYKYVYFTDLFFLSIFKPFHIS